MSQLDLPHTSELPPRRCAELREGETAVEVVAVGKRARVRVASGPHAGLWCAFPTGLRAPVGAHFAVSRLVLIQPRHDPEGILLRRSYCRALGGIERLPAPETPPDPPVRLATLRRRRMKGAHEQPQD